MAEQKFNINEIMAEYGDNDLNIWIQNDSITEKDKQNVLDVWRERLPKLGIRQEI